MIHYLPIIRGPGALMAALSGMVLLTACNQPPAVNPWADDSIPKQQWTTASREGILATGHQPVIRHHAAMPPTDAPCVSPGVSHYPLWWEDPFEDQGDSDQACAWTWQDYLAMPYCPSRFLLNTLGWPVSAVVTPPGVPMVSDGHVDPAKHPHDARLGNSPDPTATTLDLSTAREKTAAQ